MNKYLNSGVLIILTLMVGFLVYRQFSPTNQLVYVDSNQLINNYQGMIDARKVYQSKATTWQANIDTLSSEVQKSIMDYEKESQAMSKKEQELSRELIRTKQQQLAEYQKAIQEKAGQEDLEMTTTVIQEINAYLKEYGEKHSYEIILAATDAGNIVYAQEGLDITEEVLAGLNQRYNGQ